MEIVKTVPVDDHLGEMLNWAVRYSLGRRTYAVMDTCNYIKPLIPFLTNRTLWCMTRDIIEQERHGYGDECDKEYWMMILDAANEEITKRTYITLAEAIG